MRRKAFLSMKCELITDNLPLIKWMVALYVILFLFFFLNNSILLLVFFYGSLFSPPNISVSTELNTQSLQHFLNNFAAFPLQCFFLIVFSLISITDVFFWKLQTFIVLIITSFKEVSSIWLSISRHMKLTTVCYICPLNIYQLAFFLLFKYLTRKIVTKLTYNDSNEK